MFSHDIKSWPPGGSTWLTRWKLVGGASPPCDDAQVNEPIIWYWRKSKMSNHQTGNRPSTSTRTTAGAGNLTSSNQAWPITIPEPNSNEPHEAPEITCHPGNDLMPCGCGFPPTLLQCCHHTSNKNHIQHQQHTANGKRTATATPCAVKLSNRTISYGSSNSNIVTIDATGTWPPGFTVKWNLCSLENTKLKPFGLLLNWQLSFVKMTVILQMVFY